MYLPVFFVAILLIILMGWSCVDREGQAGDPDPR